MRDQVIELLLDLKKLLLDVKEELSPPGEEEEEEEDATSEDRDQDDEDEVDELLGHTRGILECLYEMSMLIHKSAHHDRVEDNTSNIGNVTSLPCPSPMRHEQQFYNPAQCHIEASGDADQRL